MLNRSWWGVFQTTQKYLGSLEKHRRFFPCCPMHLGTLENSWKMSSKILKRIQQFGNSYATWWFRVDYIGWNFFISAWKFGNLKNPDAQKDLGKKLLRMLWKIWAISELFSALKYYKSWKKIHCCQKHLGTLEKYWCWIFWAFWKNSFCPITSST